jgi:protein-S-isoprenylcysteine O-methyltransferase Ste14
MNWLKIYLLVYVVLYLLVAFVVPSYRTYKRTGINPLTFGNSERAHDYIGKVMKLLVALLLLAVLTHTIGESAYSYLVPMSYMQSGVVCVTGLILIHASLIWIFIAQFQMGNSWRIGIYERNDSDLVVHGLFPISGNPVFLGMIISTLGIFLIIPNVLTFFIALASYFIIHIQIRLEEEFLERKHRERYKDYRRQTRRLL